MTRPKAHPFRLGLFLGVGFFVVPILIIGLRHTPSGSGAGYLLGLACIWLGPHVGDRWPSLLTRQLAWIGTALLVLVAVTRFFTTAQVEQLTFERVGNTSLLSSALGPLANERDLSVGASQLFFDIGVLPERGSALPAAFIDVYDTMDEEEGAFPSPQLATLFGAQSAEGFDVLHYSLEDPRGTVLFLHGYGGNVVAMCWVMAKAAAASGFDTWCPSTRTQGDWGSRNGDATARATLERIAEYRHAEGFDGPVILAGLSAGAHGSAQLGPHLRQQIDGLILISGASPRANRSGVPTLVIYGQQDAMFPPSIIRAYIARTQARRVALDGGHFIMLTQKERVSSAIQRFLDRR